jgi:hypothetical protein
MPNRRDGTHGVGFMVMCGPPTAAPGVSSSSAIGWNIGSLTGKGHRHGSVSFSSVMRSKERPAGRNLQELGFRASMPSKEHESLEAMKVGDLVLMSREYRPALMAFFLRRVRDHAEAEDLTGQLAVCR